MMSRFLANPLRALDQMITKRAAVVAVLTAVGTVAWAGCGSGSDDRYYCDAAGCYQCDAYGCSCVAPPTHAACTGASSCAAGSVCTASGCTTTCSDAVPCAKGEVCKAGLCAAPTVDPGAKKDCTTKSDCGDGKACVAGSCEACGGSAGPCPCTTTTAATDCAAGQACVAGSCTAPANTCKFSSECDSGKVCADGQCLASCEAAPCATGFTCDKTVCKPTGTGTGCTTDQQCGGDTPQCVSGKCAKACAADPECGAGNFCDQGACVVDTRPKPNCTDDTQCAGTGAPRKCLGGFCKYTCSTAQGDAYCRTIDNRIGYCAKDLVCRTAAEASAQCLQSADCSGGQTCIDNACK
jgi:hypothetical protein